jgi:hypothetical protein
MGFDDNERKCSEFLVIVEKAGAGDLGEAA